MSRKASITSTPATSFTGISRRYAIVLDQVTTGISTLKVHAITGLVPVSLGILRNFHCLDCSLSLFIFDLYAYFSLARLSFGTLDRYMQSKLQAQLSAPFCFRLFRR